MKIWAIRCSWGKHDTVLSVSLIFKFAFMCVFEAQQLPPHLTQELLVCSLPLLLEGAPPGLHIFFFSSRCCQKNIHKGWERAVTKRSRSWPRTFDYFLASERGWNSLLRRTVMFSLLPELALSWAAVGPGSPFFTEGTLPIGPITFFIKVLRNTLRFSFPSEKWTCWELCNLLRHFF